MKKRFAILFSVLVISQLASANPVKGKFEDLLNGISNNMSSYAQTQDITALTSGGLRHQLFTIQTLAELMIPKYASMRRVHSITKQFEDRIGAYRGIREKLESARAKGDAQRIADYERQLEQQGAQLANYIKDSGWGSLDGVPAEIQGILDAIAWSDKDTTYIYGAISRFIKDIDNTQWDMSRLENGGAHDLRKEVRFYGLQVTALGGLIDTAKRKCKEPVNGNGPCQISNCLHSAMTRMNQVLSAVKDAGEAAEAIGKHPTPSLLRPAQEIYAEFREKNIFADLASEYAVCEMGR